MDCPFDPPCCICEGLEMTIKLPTGSSVKLLHFARFDDGTIDLVEENGNRWLYTGTWLKEQKITFAGAKKEGV